MLPVAHLILTEEIENTSPSEYKSQLVGRDKDISCLAQFLCKNHEENLQVIVIVGMGGKARQLLLVRFTKEMV